MRHSTLVPVAVTALSLLLAEGVAAKCSPRTAWPGLVPTAPVILLDGSVKRDTTHLLVQQELSLCAPAMLTGGVTRLDGPVTCQLDRSCHPGPSAVEAGGAHSTGDPGPPAGRAGEAQQDCILTPLAWVDSNYRPHADQAPR